LKVLRPPRHRRIPWPVPGSAPKCLVVRSLGPLDRRGDYRRCPGFLEDVLGRRRSPAAAATLKRMWSDLIVDLDLPQTGEILLAGDNVDSVKLPAFGSKLFESGNLVLVTKGEALSPDARADSTGLADNQLDLVLLRDAFGSIMSLGPVMREAFRILKPGGGVMITEFDADTMLDSRPQQYPQKLLSDLHPQVAGYLRQRHPRPMDIAMALVSAGFKDGDAYILDFPLGHFTDYQIYADSVAAGAWRGLDQVSGEDRQAVLDQLPSLMRSVAPTGDFFDAEPISVARACKPE